MNTACVCLAVGIFLPYVWAFTGTWLRSRELGSLDNKNPRQQVMQTTGMAARAYAAQQNAWEALMVFAAAVFLVSLGNPDSGAASVAAVIWVLARLAHGIFYLADLDVARSLSFMVGMGSVITIIAAAF